jgi:hypothetical protein
VHESATLAVELPLDALKTAAGRFVRRIDPLDDPHWDADLASCPGASFFHTTAWARVLKSTYGYTPAYFALRESGRLRSVLPFMEVNSWLTGRRGVSLPFTDECAPLAPDFDTFRRLYQEALVYARVRHWKYIECRGGRSRFGDAPASTSFFGHLLDLRPGADKVFSGFDSPVQRALRKADRSGLTIEFSRDLDAVRAFYHLLAKTRKRHGVPPQPFPFFAAIHRHILAENLGWVVLARHEGKPVAAAVYFHFGKTAIYKYGASDKAYQHLRANNLVMGEAIKRHADEGFETLNFGRTSITNPGLRKFKLSWGTSEYSIDYVRHDLRTDAFVAAEPPSSGWQTRLLKILPAPVSRLIGSVLYKHVA